VRTGSSRFRGGRPPLAVAVAASALLSAAACSGGASGPQALPPLHPVVPSPTATRPGPPAPATGRQAELAAATAVVRRYFAIVNNLHRDMNPQALGSIFAAGCACNAQVEAIRSASRLGEHYIDHATVNELRPSLDGPRSADVLADYAATPGGLVNGQGVRVTRTAGMKHIHWDFRLQLTHGRWTVTAIEHIS
jgi:hypothetical protein